MAGKRTRQDVTLRITRKDGSTIDQTVKLRIDTPIEVDSTGTEAS